MRISFLLLLTLLTSAAFGQTSTSATLADQVPDDGKYDETIIDPVYGINIYENLNFQLEGDSVRNCEGYACQAWVEDHWENGALMHRGYYMDGQLKVYKNYYPNGAMEREFKALDTYRCLMIKYYDTGVMKSEVKYVEGSAIRWSDYFPDGTLEYHEEYHKSFNYHLKREKYGKGGVPEEIFECVNRKKLIFDQKEYHTNGQLKEGGQLEYDNDMFDFQRIGKWMYYDENGNLMKEEWYNNGSVHKEKEY